MKIPDFEFYLGIFWFYPYAMGKGFGIGFHKGHQDYDRYHVWELKLYFYKSFSFYLKKKVVLEFKDKGELENVS
jgi:hypothetical protein